MIISLNTDEPMEIDQPIPTIKYKFSKTDWHEFKTNLTNIDDTEIPNTRNLTIDEINKHIEKLNANINTAIDRTVPRITDDYNSTDRYITPTIKNLRRVKSTLITRLNRLSAINNYTPANDTQISRLKYTLKKVRHEIKRAFHNSVSDYWKNKISNITIHKPKDLFPTVNTIFRPKETNSIDTLQIHSSNTEIITNADINQNSIQTDDDGNLQILNIDDKLNILGAHFEKAHTQNNHIGKTQLSNIIEQKINTLKAEIDDDRRNDRTVCTFSDTNKAENPNPKTIPPNFFTSVYELVSVLKKLNSKKSSSFDNIPNIVLKHLPPLYIHNYSIIFNNCLNRAYFPTAWKIAKLIAIKKKGKNSSDPSSYRPISLLPNISKIFEVTINKAIDSFCTSNNLIPETQFGFRFKHSTIHAITKFTSDICWARNAGDCVGAVLLDLEKAFDTVWLDGLFFKLMKRNFPMYLVKIIWNMVHGKQFYVTEGSNISSKVFTVQNGLQQEKCHCIRRRSLSIHH
ncbi:uncharacterized protein LOC143260972 [Megalopta genalis]|uniref:uncharacterized protein LOC143260972 n=1 Tax=Megalopta genalis TaxID=115081 RepID=UPI003FD26F7A